MVRCLHVAVLVFVVGGCSKPTQEADAGAPKVEDAGTPSAPDASLTAVQIAPDAAVPLMEVTSEVKSRKDPRTDRPANALKAEAVYDGLNGRGIVVTNRRQVLAQIVSAAYCLKADAAPDIDLVVCEFDDNEGVAKGKKMMAVMPYPRREILTWKTSTVSIGRLSDAKPTSDTASKISAFVKTL